MNEFAKQGAGFFPAPGSWKHFLPLFGLRMAPLRERQAGHAPGSIKEAECPLTSKDTEAQRLRSWLGGKTGK